MYIKYIFDRVVSCVGLIVLSPLILVVALLVHNEMSGCSVFFKQRRVGKNGNIFTMVKFRTMIDNHGGSSVSVAGEKRITPLGSKLRKYKLDELPELWNVLKGDMSFVGPRPDVPGYADRLQGDDREVLSLRPGITGPASLKYRDEEEQIAFFIKKRKESMLNSPQNMTDEQLAIWYNDNIIYPDKVRLNRYYLHNYSFFMDIKMIFATILGKRIKYNKELI